MRVLALTNLYPNPLQPERAPFNRQQLRHLADRHPVRVIAPVAWTEELMYGWRHRLRLPRSVFCDGLSVEHPRYLFPPKVLRGWYGHCYRASVQPAFQRALHQFQPDVLFAPWAYPDGWAAVRLARRAGLPVVIKVLGSDVLCLANSPARQRRTAEALRQADGVVAVSRDLAGKVACLGVEPDKVHVVYDGVNAIHFHPGPAAAARDRLGLDGDEPLLLYVGRLVPVKGLDVLLEACSRLAEKPVRFRCVLIGDGPLRKRLQAQIAARRLCGQVRLQGTLAHAQLPDWFRAAQVVVLPSFSEGVPSVLLEAAACGTPFVASRVGGVAEIAHLGPNQLVALGNADDLAQALEKFLTSARPAVAAAATPIRTWTHSAADLAGVLEDVVHRHQAAGPQYLSPTRPRAEVV